MLLEEFFTHSLAMCPASPHFQQTFGLDKEVLSLVVWGLVIGGAVLGFRGVEEEGVVDEAVVVWNWLQGLNGRAGKVRLLLKDDVELKDLVAAEFR